MADILAKIKGELKIRCFIELADYFTKLYNEIIAQTDVGRKTLIFRDGLTKFPNVVNKENQENCK